MRISVSGQRICTLGLLVPDSLLLCFGLVPVFGGMGKRGGFIRTDKKKEAWLNQTRARHQNTRVGQHLEGRVLSTCTGGPGLKGNGGADAPCAVRWVEFSYLNTALRHKLLKQCRWSCDAARNGVCRHQWELCRPSTFKQKH